MEITGSPLPPPPVQAFFAQLCSLLFMVGLGLQFAGQLVMPAPIYEKFNENRMAAVMLMFGCNIVAGKLIATGAFEIFLDDAQLWSKMDTDQFPKIEMIVQQVAAQLGAGATPEVTSI